MRDVSLGTCCSVSVLLHINGKQSSRKRCESNFSACVIGGSEKKKQNSESAVCEGILIPYTVSEGNLFHSQKMGLKNGRFELFPNADRAVQSSGRRQIRDFRLGRRCIQLQLARDCVPFCPNVEESIHDPSDISRQVRGVSISEPARCDRLCRQTAQSRSCRSV